MKAKQAAPAAPPAPSKEETLLQHPEWFIAGTHYIPADELAKFGATGR